MSADLTDPDTADNSVTVDTEVLPREADLSLTKSDNKDPVTGGDTLIYTITVNNAGPAPAENGVATDTLPAGVTL